jgi:hypothetical protein
MTTCTKAQEWLRDYPEIELAKTHDLFDNWRTPDS